MKLFTTFSRCNSDTTRPFQSFRPCLLLVFSDTLNILSIAFFTWFHSFICTWLPFYRSSLRTKASLSSELNTVPDRALMLIWQCDREGKIRNHTELVCIMITSLWGFFGLYINYTSVKKKLSNLKRKSTVPSLWSMYWCSVCWNWIDCPPVIFAFETLRFWLYLILI